MQTEQQEVNTSYIGVQTSATVVETVLEFPSGLHKRLTVTRIKDITASRRYVRGVGFNEGRRPVTRRNNETVVKNSIKEDFNLKQVSLCCS